MNVKRSSNGPKWTVSIKYEDKEIIEEEFDKLVVTTGTFRELASRSTSSMLGSYH